MKERGDRGGEKRRLDLVGSHAEEGPEGNKGENMLYCYSCNCEEILESKRSVLSASETLPQKTKDCPSDSGGRRTDKSDSYCSLTF